jgi:hypothetical protein
MCQMNPHTSLQDRTQVLYRRESWILTVVMTTIQTKIAVLWIHTPRPTTLAMMQAIRRRRSRECVLGTFLRTISGIVRPVGM